MDTASARARAGELAAAPSRAAAVAVVSARWLASGSGAGSLGTQHKGRACTGTVVGAAGVAVRVARAAVHAGRLAAAVTTPRAMPCAVHAF